MYMSSLVHKNVLVSFEGKIKRPKRYDTLIITLLLIYNNIYHQDHRVIKRRGEA